MWRYIVKRLITTFFLLFGITFIVYLIMELTPGDPVMIKLGTDYTPELYETTKIQMGLDKPFLYRYFKYIYDVFIHFDFGTSYLGRDVVKEIVMRAPKTFLISVLSIIVSAVIGIPLGYGLVGMWIGFALDENIRGIILMRRWRSGKWRDKGFVK